MKILYVEDDPIEADLALHFLTGAMPPHEVEIAPNIATAIDRLKKPPGEFDLVLLDLLLPDGSGLEALTYIRENRLPCAVVILTGAEDPAAAELAVKCGADGYLVKRGGYLQHLSEHLNSVLRRFLDESTHKSRPLRVLYVEPEAIDIALTKVHLARFAPHIHLETAPDGERVLNLLDDQDMVASVCDVLLFAYDLPGLNALDTLKLLRDRNRVSVPAVLLASIGSEAIASQVLRLGFDGYLTKQPFYLHQLPAALESAFYRAEVTREHAAQKSAQQRYQDLVTRIPVGVYRLRISPADNWMFDYASPRFFEIFGLPQDSPLYEAVAVFSMAQPDDLAEFMRRINISRRCLEPVDWEGRFVIGGQLCWLRIEFTATRLDNGDVVHDGIVKNITGYKQMEMEQTIKK
ncbi:MAG: response regulator [Gallionella sp.]|nr:response regulator [Gallionella sp.]